MQNTSLVKVGLWGGQGGGPHDVKLSIRRHNASRAGQFAVESRHLCNSFTYVDINGKDCSSGLWGGNAGTPQQVLSEFNTWF